ncbi:MAG: hypothetical protein ABJE66_10965 [Deltaproteobacteria bacterium]
MVLAGSFIATMAIAWLMVRRSKRLVRWLVIAAVMFCIVAGIARLAGDGRTARVATRLYDAGGISWNDYRTAVAADERAQDTAGLIGALAVMFCFGCGTLVRRSSHAS